MKEREEFNLELGRRIKLARREAGLKAEELSEMAGITPQFLSEVERGKKGIGSYNLAALARGLGVSADYLLYGRRGVEEEREEFASRLAAVPPAQMEMARDVLEYALRLIGRNIPW